VPENDSPHSGSRREPGVPPQPDPDPIWQPLPLPPPPQPQPEAGRAPSRSRGPRGRVALAAAAVGLVVAGGIGGFVIGQFVIGQASSGSAATDSGVVQNGVPAQGGTESRSPGQFPGDRGHRPGVGNGTPPAYGGDGSQTAPGGTDQATGAPDEQSTT